MKCNLVTRTINNFVGLYVIYYIYLCRAYFLKDVYLFSTGTELQLQKPKQQTDV